MFQLGRLLAIALNFIKFFLSRFVKTNRPNVVGSVFSLLIDARFGVVWIILSEKYRVDHNPTING
jgi:hypothetical protein